MEFFYKRLKEELFLLYLVFIMNWIPQKIDIVKDESLKAQLFDEGYCIDGNIGPDLLKKLQAVYKKHHKVKTENGGMFYSLYSLDLTYRKLVNEEIGALMKELYGKKFENYKTVLNSFIIKYPGEESAFTLHQDSTSLDESKYSALSVWIPLQDTNLENGCLCVVPKSQKIFYPYRGISFPTPFSNIESVVRDYLVPINMKAGDILLFDNRMVHFSPENNSKEPRVVVMSGLFPKEAKILNCYKDELNPSGPLEIYEQKDDFLLVNTKFFHDCRARPTLGIKREEIHVELPDFTAEEFIKKAEELGLKRTNIPKLEERERVMHTVSEPAEKSNSLFSFIKQKFS